MFMEFSSMPYDAPAASVDRDTLETVARLAVTELTSATASSNRGAASGSDVIELKSDHGATAVSARDLSRAIEAAFRTIIGRGDVMVLRGGSTETGAILRKLVERLPSMIEARRQTLTEKHIEALVDAYLPADALAPVMPDIEADNARAQADFLKTYRTLTADDVAQRAGHSAANRSATAHRWKAERKIFAVRAGGREVYPEFQFREGRPLPALQPVLTALSGRSGWQIAFWFISPNGWLGGPAPIERLEDGAALAAAAGHEAEAWAG
jgi:hypothetical protein